MLTAATQLLTRDIMLAWRQCWDGITTILFFILVISLVPLGVDNNAAILVKLGAGICWIAALLSALLSLEKIFYVDYEDGTLDQFLFAPLPLELVALIKIFAHWVTHLVPLIIIAPLLAASFYLKQDAVLALVTGLLLGTPVLSLLGGIGAAVTLGARRGALLLSLLILPLYIPVLILGAGAVDITQAGFSPERHFLLLGALLVFTLSFAPFAVASLLRQATAQ